MFRLQRWREAGHLLRLRALTCRPRPAPRSVQGPGEYTGPRGVYRTRESVQGLGEGVYRAWGRECTGPGEEQDPGECTGPGGGSVQGLGRNRTRGSVKGPGGVYRAQGSVQGLQEGVHRAWGRECTGPGRVYRARRRVCTGPAGGSVQSLQEGVYRARGSEHTGPGGMYRAWGSVQGLVKCTGPAGGSVQDPG